MRATLPQCSTVHLFCKVPKPSKKAMSSLSTFHLLGHQERGDTVITKVTSRGSCSSMQKCLANAAANSASGHSVVQASEELGEENDQSLFCCEFKAQGSKPLDEEGLKRHTSINYMRQRESTAYSMPFVHSSYGSKSNLDRFLDHTTPSVQCQYNVKSSIADMMKTTNLAAAMPLYNLGDLWSSFDEWSAYGAGVPLCLPTGENIVQYYVPYLSAVQIYLCLGSPVLKQRKGYGDNSDSSDVEFSSDSERVQPELRNDGWDTASCISSERSSSMEDSMTEHGDLVFEFFEKCSPHGRPPLQEKIAELALDFPELLSLQSDKLSPASWVSVAWYPIYRIPIGPTMHELATCFLSFHSLSTPSIRHGQNRDGECVEQEYPSLQTRRVNSGMLELPAFGLASYKLSGPFWASAAPADRRKAFCLSSSAELWLKQLRVQHPDFIFFASRW